MNPETKSQKNLPLKLLKKVSSKTKRKGIDEKKNEVSKWYIVNYVESVVRN